MIIFEDLFLSKPFYDRKGKSYCFTRTCSISCNDITSFINIIKSLILNRKESFNTFLVQSLKNFLIFNEIFKIAFLVMLCLINLYRFRIYIFYLFSTWILEIRNVITRLSFCHCWKRKSNLLLFQQHNNTISYI